jgi:aminopeptidase C
MFVNLIRKYGILPKTIMPETENSNGSGSVVVSCVLIWGAAQD